MSHTSTSTVVSSLARRPSSRDLRILRVAWAVLTLAFLLVATAFVLPSAGLLLFIGGLALLFALPFAVVTTVVADLDPTQ